MREYKMYRHPDMGYCAMVGNRYRCGIQVPGGCPIIGD